MAGGRNRVVAALVGGAVVLTLGAGPAAAERNVERDRRGDVLKVEEGATSGVAAPQAGVDVLRSSFRHGPHRVRARIRFVDLTPTGKRLRVWVNLRDGRGRTHYVGVEGVPGDRSGRAWLMGPRGADLPCRVRHRISYAEDVVTVSLPRRCLGAPRVLRFGVLSEHVRRDWRYAYLDDGLGDSVGRVRWSAPLSAG